MLKKHDFHQKKFQNWLDSLPVEFYNDYTNGKTNKLDDRIFRVRTVLYRYRNRLK